MKEQFLNFVLSQRIYNIGYARHFSFTAGSLAYYRLNNKNFIVNNTLRKHPSFSAINFIEAPLIQQARDFLIEKYNKFPIVFSDGFKWTYDLRWPDLTELDNKYPGVMFPKRETEREYFDTYNEAELKAIEKIIEIEENNGTINNI